MIDDTSVAAAPHFWDASQPGFKFSNAPVGTPQFFAEVEAHRYGLEPHIPEIVRFDQWADRDVLELGCGIATDGINFARSGARYTGLDQSATALALARRRFELEGRDGTFVHGSVVEPPLKEHFDLVYSHGVLHHVEQTGVALHKAYELLRPGGTALVMLYHRHSLNYHLSIMLLRRALAMALWTSAGQALARRITREDVAVLEGQRGLLQKHGINYLLDRQFFLSNNTDGPGNPLSKVYSRNAARTLFAEAGFVDMRVAIRFLNLRIYPSGDRLARTKVARGLEGRIGWHLYVKARRGV
jgi:SAM-dependent methyltransferase